MKYEVVGWTAYDDQKYPSYEYVSDEESQKAWDAVAKEIREKGYSIGGDAHQFREDCTPVLNDGSAFRCSMREWGALMADAYGVGDEKYSYMLWYMDDYNESSRPEGKQTPIYPTPGVDKTRIVKKKK